MPLRDAITRWEPGSTGVLLVRYVESIVGKTL
jgi:hypothetical protein